MLEPQQPKRGNVGEPTHSRTNVKRGDLQGRTIDFSGIQLMQRWWVSMKYFIIYINNSLTMGPWAPSLKSSQQQQGNAFLCEFNTLWLRRATVTVLTSHLRDMLLQGGGEGETESATPPSPSPL